MKTLYSKENLYHSLPDYISGNLDDKTVQSDIEAEIENNPEFKNEFEEMKITFGFLNSVEFESPQESYFNNLSVRINERISHETGTESFWERLGLLWKILIPSIPVLIIAVVLFFTMDNRSKETILTNTTEKNESIQKNDAKDSNDKLNLTEKSDNTKVSNEKLIKDQGQNEITNNRTRHNPKRQVHKSSENFVLTEQASVATTKTSLIADNSDNQDLTNSDSDDDVLLLKEDDENFDDDILQFTPEEQQEILEKLNKSQI